MRINGDQCAVDFGHLAQRRAADRNHQRLDRGSVLFSAFGRRRFALLFLAPELGKDDVADLKAGFAFLRFERLGPFDFVRGHLDGGAVGEQQFGGSGGDPGHQRGFPGPIAARQFHSLEGFRRRLIHWKRRDRPAPAVAPVVGDEAVAQRGLSRQLKARVDGGADRQAALFERVFAVPLDQVPAQFLHKIGRRHEFRAAKATHRRQRPRERLVHLLAGDVTIFPHPLEDIVAPLEQAFGV